MKAKILLIDDETAILELVADYFEKEFQEIITAESGKEGLEKFKANPGIDAIVCDINMPNMQGLEVIKKIRELSKDTPFIFFTGFGSRENMLEAVKYGAYDFIEKPDVTNLLKAVKSSVSKNREKSHKVVEEHLSEYKKLLGMK